jgi:hypothetical protein
MFYSPAIEEIAAVKVANALGADPQTLWNNKPIVEINMDSAQTQESPVQEKCESRSNSKNPVKKSAFAVSRPRLSLEKPNKNILMPALGSALVFTSCLAFFYTQTDFSLKALANDFLSLAMNKREPQTQSKPLAPTPMPAPTKASPEPIKAMPQPHKPIPTVVQSVAFGGCDDQKTAIYLSTDQPQKAGISVYIEALEDVNLCVVDSAGVQHTTTLKAKENKTYRGSPPWSVHASYPAMINLFFQGRKMHWPEVKGAFVILKETAGIF